MPHSDEVRDFRFTPHGIELDSPHAAAVAPPRGKPRATTRAHARRRK
jgi:hypothetical protein